ncbi:hypothetical protein ZK2_20 [Klebsiella phage vB_KpnP_ZK2]|uniref:Uncharacterized protein n=1 Tax=Klebsiella phage vB_KpnP_ZK2 TaxID=2894362 RepID=A0AAE8YH80_9CAUD|nr:hypothetical protein ZK2_20 [Klebsiella phage vB_KpnP_ZK2]
MFKLIETLGRLVIALSHVKQHFMQPQRPLRWQLKLRNLRSSSNDYHQS